MNLRKKILVIFCSLALMTLLVASVTAWTTTQWRKNSVLLEEHYQRSLILHRIRSFIFSAIKEIPDAVTGGDSDAAQEFSRLIAPVDNDIEKWTRLAHTDNELKQVKEIKAVYQQLVADSFLVFRLMEQGKRSQALLVMEEKIDRQTLHQFQQLSEEAMLSDQRYRAGVIKQIKDARQTDEILLAIAAFGTVSLILLLSAYLASDLFNPLKRIKRHLQKVSDGDFFCRLPEDRHDELGEIHLVFNRMLEAINRRQQSSVLGDTHKDKVKSVQTLAELPSRLVFHKMLAKLNSLSSELATLPCSADKAIDNNTQCQIEQLIYSLVHYAEMAFPLDLNIEKFKVSELIYETIPQFYKSFSQKNISIEINIERSINNLSADKLKLKQVLAELVCNAMNNLEGSGCHIGVRAALVYEGAVLKIEVADDGSGIERNIDYNQFDFETMTINRTNERLIFARQIIEQHGGELVLHSVPGEGSYVRFTLPTSI